MAGATPEVHSFTYSFNQPSVGAEGLNLFYVVDCINSHIDKYERSWINNITPHEKKHQRPNDETLKLAEPANTELTLGIALELTSG